MIGQAGETHYQRQRIVADRRGENQGRTAGHSTADDDIAIKAAPAPVPDPSPMSSNAALAFDYLRIAVPLRCAALCGACGILEQSQFLVIQSSRLFV